MARLPYAEVIRQFAATKPVVLEEPRRHLRLEVTPDEYYEDPAHHMKRLHKKSIAKEDSC
jgi:hypothetical protein